VDGFGGGVGGGSGRGRVVVEGRRVCWTGRKGLVVVRFVVVSVGSSSVCWRSVWFRLLHPVLLLHHEHSRPRSQKLVPSDLSDQASEKSVGFGEGSSERGSGESKEGDVGFVVAGGFFVEDVGVGDKLFDGEVGSSGSGHSMEVSFVVGEHGAGVEGEEGLTCDEKDKET